VAPRFLGHWLNQATGKWTMELEYVPGVPLCQLQDLQQVKAYMAALIQVNKYPCPPMTVRQR
jgi:hypothetical protein